MTFTHINSSGNAVVGSDVALVVQVLYTCLDAVRLQLEAVQAVDGARAWPLRRRPDPRLAAITAQIEGALAHLKPGAV